ncbi:aminopeptidase N [Rhizobiales bacterium GAS191]|nr:aminopeptidase N [Rhizobiales bacterium GAS188]SEE54923.1 aminopeptidase N [Rhizobiales bacterium GAS191]
MRPETPPATRLEDYRVPDYLVETVDLDISLQPHETRVRTKTAFVPNPKGVAGAELVLDADELTLVSIALDGRRLEAGDYRLTETALTLPSPPARRFVLDIETRLDPTANTKLSGLYRSNGTYCTQCEAQGFRRITYFQDRPDLLAVYTTRIEAERDEAPVLLANGNPVMQGQVGAGTRHFAVWHDPWPKPSYLFALVGGRLGRVAGAFETRSGRKVELGVYVEPGKEQRATYALDALERSMRWDEESFGREYDLDVFNIVAVSDFNMGAMENKGLNIFNDKYVLASTQTATDADYANIEAIIAHEYFHNWTGNRITCRDWFQLSLKEGLTVFRDHEFTSDMRSRTVKRISDVRTLRLVQFTEDAGPLAHPVRPPLYHEINNFYTATVYEKGAELIRMLKTIIGAEAFGRGMDLYFERCDGTAATVEDFLACFADVTGRDLSGFMRWYDQAGTPVVSVDQRHDEAARSTTLTFTQATSPTPGQAEKMPVEIPIAIGLLSQEGEELPLACDHPDWRADGVFTLRQTSAEITFRDIAKKPVASLFRSFSAPVRLDFAQSFEDLLLLAGHDQDRFNRWQAIQSFAGKIMLGAIREAAAAQTLAFDPRFFAALESLLTREPDHAFAAEALAIPSEQDIAREIGTNVDPDAILAARNALLRGMGQALERPLLATYERLAGQGPYSPDAKSAARRNLRNTALALLVIADPARHAEIALRQFKATDNMNDRLAALSALSRAPEAMREPALAEFERAHSEDPLILDKWFALQARIPEPGTLDKVKQLMGHPAFSLSNPNRIYALVMSFSSGNASGFNRANGSGYEFIADIVAKVDASNPAVAARLLTSFRSWRSMEAGRRGKAEAALRAIAARGNLSTDVSDIVTRSLA